MYDYYSPWETRYIIDLETLEEADTKVPTEEVAQRVIDARRDRGPIVRRE